MTVHGGSRYTPSTVNPLLSDPWIAQQIDEAVAPYVGVLPPAQIAWMREQLAETLAGDEGAARLLHRAHPRSVDISGELARDGKATDDGDGGAGRSGGAAG